MPTPVSKAKRQDPSSSDTASITLDFATIDVSTSTGTKTDTATAAFTCSSLYGSEGLKATCKCPRVPKATTTKTVAKNKTTVGGVSFSLPFVGDCDV